MHKYRSRRSPLEGGMRRDTSICSLISMRTRTGINTVDEAPSLHSLENKEYIPLLSRGWYFFCDVKLRSLICA